MRIIKKVSVKYFRSLHSVEVKKCSSVNVFSGRNDSGKSNVVKALNLFFNNQADWGSVFEFYENFSKKRLEEVRKDTIKGRQFISVKVEFDRPSNYKGSLPETFSVEKKWYRDNLIPEISNNLESLHKRGKLPSSLTTAQRSLATFLNKVHFEYVPAIRDRNYVNELLSRLQRTLLDMSIEKNEALFTTAQTLADHIENQVVDLKSDFESATNIETSIEPPASASGLFQSFLVSTMTDNGSVPLKFRGDGLQSRYIASVLHYIALNSKDFYVWGYEEPEIALEYSHVSSMAKDFLAKYSEESQIFLSTHSPAFISLESDKVSCYRVSQDDSETFVANTALSKDFEGKSLLKEELGIIEIQREVHDFYSAELKKLDNLNKRVLELQEEVDEKQRALIVTEGKTDARIFEVAFGKIGVLESQVIFRSCDNAGGQGDSGGAGPLAKLIESIHPDDGRIVIALFDNDGEGQKEFERLSKNFKLVDWCSEVKMHKNGFAWAMLISEPEFRKGYVAAKNLCVEYLFEDDVLKKKFNDGKSLEIKPVDPKVVVDGGLRLELDGELRRLLSEEVSKCAKIGAGKEKFATEIVPSLDIESFSGFSEIANRIERIQDA